MHSCRNLLPGDPAPWFHQRSSVNPDHAFGSVAGRSVVLCFFMSAANGRARAALDAALAQGSRLDDQTAAFFGVSIDPADAQQKRRTTKRAGYRYFWDGDSKIGKLYRAAPTGAQAAAAVPARQIWVVLDPTMPVLKVVPFRDDGSSSEEVFAFLEQPPPSRFAGFEVPAPVLMLPNVFEAEFCQRLFALDEAQGGQDSGFRRENDGKTVITHDPGHKRRKDHEIYRSRGDQAGPGACDPSHRARNSEGPSVPRRPHAALYRQLLCG